MHLAAVTIIFFHISTDKDSKKKWSRQSPQDYIRLYRSEPQVSIHEKSKHFILDNRYYI